jgi:hypothetical protein
MPCASCPVAARNDASEEYFVLPHSIIVPGELRWTRS